MRQFAHLVVRFPRMNIFILVLVTLTFGFHIFHLQLEKAAESFTRVADDPELDFYDEITSTFGFDEIIVIGFENEDIFSQNTMEMISRITERIEGLPGAERVLSLANVMDITSTEEGIAVRRLAAGAPANQSHTRRIRERALANPFCKRTLVSEDGRASSIIVFLDNRPGDLEYRNNLIKEIKAVLQEEGDKTRFHISGRPVIFSAIFDYLIPDILLFIPLSFIVVIVTSWWCFRNLAGVLLPLGTVSMAAIWTMGLFSWLGNVLNNYTAATPLFILVVGCAYSVHVMTQYYEEANHSQDRKQVVVNTIEHIGYPVIFTTLTTMVGFGSLMVNRLVPIVQVGKFVTFGVFLAGFLALFFIPSSLMLLPLPREARRMRFESGLVHRLLMKIGSFNLKRKNSILVIGSLLIIISSWGMFHLRAEANPLDWFRRDTDVIQAIEFLDSRLAGARAFTLSLRGREKDSIIGPQVLREMADLQDYINHLEDVDYTLSVVDILKEIKSKLHGDNPQRHDLPSSREEAAQYLFLYSLSGEEEDLDRLINHDRSWGLLLVRLTSNLSTLQMKDVVRSIEDYARKHFHAHGVETRVTGHEILFINMIDAMGEGLFISLIVATVLIFLIMLIVLRSFSGGVIALLPNIIPLILCMGYWGWAGITIDVATSMIGVIIIGIAVDDTIHYLHRYKKEINKDGDYEKAMFRALKTSGRAITFTTVTLTAGFSIMAFSQFGPLQLAGRLLSPPLILALVTDLIFLSAVFLRFKPKFVLK